MPRPNKPMTAFSQHLRSPWLPVPLRLLSTHEGQCHPPIYGIIAYVTARGGDKRMVRIILLKSKMQ